MKKVFIVLGIAVATLMACTKETPVQENSVIDASNLCFNIDVTRVDELETKAVKVGWTDGDVVYVFFEDNSSNYVKMTYNAGTGKWTYSDKDDGTSYTGLDLAASGKKLTAVYLPFNTDAPTYNSGWTFEDRYTYYLTSGAVGYTVTVGTPSTLSATLEMTAPAGFIQFFLPDAGAVSTYGSISQFGRYALMEASFTPTTCGKIIGGTDITPKQTSPGYPMWANPVDGEGYYFYGILDPAKRGNPQTYNFSLVQNHRDYKYAVGTQKKTFSGKTLGGSGKTAVRFASGTTSGNGHSAFPTQLKYVDLGLASGTLWAIGNLTDNGTTGSLVPAIELGKYYAWGEIVGHTPANMYTSEEKQYLNTVGFTVGFNEHCPDFNTVTGHTEKFQKDGDVLSAEYDAATHYLGANWHIPDKADVDELVALSYDHFTNGLTGVACRRFQGTNGLKLCVPCCGYGGNPSQSIDYVKLIGNYSTGFRMWSRTSAGGDNAYRFRNLEEHCFGGSKYYLFNLRPVYEP